MQSWPLPVYTRWRLGTDAFHCMYLSKRSNLLWFIFRIDGSCVAPTHNSCAHLEYLAAYTQKLGCTTPPSPAPGGSSNSCRCHRPSKLIACTSLLVLNTQAVLLISYLS